MYLRQATDLHERYLDLEETWPQEWRDAFSVNDDSVLVDPDQLRALHAKLDQVVRRYREAGAAADGARKVRVGLIFTPADPRWE